LAGKHLLEENLVHLLIRIGASITDDDDVHRMLLDKVLTCQATASTAADWCSAVPPATDSTDLGT
jgi:hypothetical protein